jgi:hypothetical protein
MNKQTRKKYSGLIGIGMLYTWGCAILYWVGSPIGFIGAGLVSISGIAVFFYVSSLEEELNKSTQND